MDTSSPSVALIRLLREITRLGKALDKVTYRKQSHFNWGQGPGGVGGEGIDQCLGIGVPPRV